MNADLNRAASKRYRALIAVCMGTLGSGNLHADDPQHREASPYRISASPASFEKDSRSGTMRWPSESLIVREPADDQAPRVSSFGSTPRRIKNDAKWGEFNSAPVAPENSALPVPPKPAGNTEPELTEMSTPATAIDVASVMEVFSEPEMPALQTAARKAKASREEAFVRNCESSAGRIANQSSQQVLPGFSVGGLREEAAKSLDEAALSLSTGANLTGAAAATEALKKIAQSIDIQRSDNLASADLAAALLALHEAEDFVGRYGTVDKNAIARMVRAHQTTVLKGFDTTNLTGIGAADVYMDFARQTLGSIASADPLAAHAIGLLGKSYRNRGSEAPMALAASVHLMRAAASASPSDRGLVTELAAVLERANLVDEASIVRAHASRLPLQGLENEIELGMSTQLAVTNGTTIGPNGTRQSIRVEQISPEVFASISRTEAGPNGNSVAPQETVFEGNPAVASTPKRVVNSQAMYGSPVASPASAQSAAIAETAQEGNAVSRAFKSMTRIWR